MSLFFITFFLAYGGMHLYAFLRARAALQFGLLSAVAISIFMLAMLFAPILIRQAERRGLEDFARILSFVGYTWLGLLFLFCSASLCVDIYRQLLRAVELIAQADYRHLKFGARSAFYIPLVYSMLIAGYGYIDAQNIRVETITIKTPKIPESIGRLRIVQISDVHLGLIIRDDRLRNILGRVKEAGPDIVVSTGDLVDGQINGLPGLAEMFLEINPPYGKYAVTGNHEFYAGLDQALAFTRKAGFIILRGQAVEIQGLLNIAGVDDPAGRNLGLQRDVPEVKLLSRLSRDRFTLFLKHRPLVKSESTGLFDLQLSGHVHRGQIFPFSILTKLYYPVHAGLASLDKGSRLYVSRGTGTWGPPIRFLSPPEITVIDLFHGEPE